MKQTRYIHIKNLEKYHPGYKDRKLQWAKLHFSMVNGDPEFEIIESEIDKWRFAAMICLELNAQKPLLDDDNYWKKYFDINKRPMFLTLQMLHNFVDIVTELSKECNVDKDKDKEEDKDKDIYVDFEKSTLALWNSFCEKYPVLAKVREVSEKRRLKLKKRFERKSFRDFKAILEAIEEQPFLLGENDRHWKVNFDRLIENDTNYLKVLERRYKEQQKSSLIFKKEG